MAAPRPQNLLLLLLLVSLLAAFAPRGADAWGKEGHIMTCKIAEGTATTLRACRGCASWEAINNYTEQLYTYGASPKSSYNLTESLMFLAHFVGDVHQPLHVSFEEDEGGNTIQVWDVSIIDSVMKDFYNKDLDTMVDALQTNLTLSAPVKPSCYFFLFSYYPVLSTILLPFLFLMLYAIESIDLSCNYAYKDVTQNITLGDDYYFTRYPVVERRLAQGGVRLGDDTQPYILTRK
ncbi:hypothetical protein ACQ4PT_063654 [Festuca glaucescens]